MFSYVGNKDRYKDLILPLILSKKYNFYSELFLGSGSIFMNSKNNFDKYILNDLDKGVYKIWTSLIQLNSYIEILNYKEKIIKDFGNIQESKEGYYNFRNWYNQNYWKKDNIESGIYLLFLFNSCMNNLVRFGPSGFTQSNGNRFTIFSKREFDILQNKKSKIELHNKNYIELISDINEGIIFLDPPYYSQEASYTNKFTLETHIEFLNIIKNKSCDIIYTDVLNEHNSVILKNWNKIKIRNIRSVSIKSKHITKNEEYIFINFDKINKFERLLNE